MTVKKFDAIIVGSGQAGTPLAFKMAGEGKKVAFIEKEYWESSDNIIPFKGEASFIGFKTLEVNGEQIQAEHIFINTGARPFIPKGFEEVNYLTNQSILQLDELPEHLIIVGGSYIGLEFGQMFKRFGSKVTVIERNEQIIAREDDEISKSILETLEEEGVEFRLNATCISGKNNKDGTVTVSVDCKKGAPDITGTHLLLAVGRKPNTDMLNLQATGLSADKRGYLEVNAYLETSVAGIYALGDCNGKGAFTHTAYNDYEIVAENMFDGKDRKVRIGL